MIMTKSISKNIWKNLNVIFLSYLVVPWNSLLVSSRTPRHQQIQNISMSSCEVVCYYRYVYSYACTCTLIEGFVKSCYCYFRWWRKYSAKFARTESDFYEPWAISTSVSISIGQKSALIFFIAPSRLDTKSSIARIYPSKWLTQSLGCQAEICVLSLVNGLMRGQFLSLSSLENVTGKRDRRSELECELNIK